MEALAIRNHDWSEPVDAAGWLPLKERERLIAEARGHKPRPSSFVMYMRYALLGDGRVTAPVPPDPDLILSRTTDATPLAGNEETPR